MRGPPLSPCRGAERIKVRLCGPVSTGAALLSHSPCRGSAQLLEPPEAWLGVGWGPMKSGSLSALHSDPGCAEGKCSSLGIWISGLPRALAGLSGQSARPLGQGRPWARPCRCGEWVGSPSNDEAERVTGQGKQRLGCVGVVLPALLGAG